MFIFRILLIVFYIAVAIVFGWFAKLVFHSSIMPSLLNGTLDVQGSSRILNVNWIGNEIYIIFSLYGATSALFAYLTFRLAMLMAKKQMATAEET
ncbi:hypothetical protein [Thalassotalea eurytherma]|uniref:DUF2523 domain-containing protein n=1 Tax=Thalassotalea eurytherma TaxID=1144278 RepID=A0ABQ6H6X7_9GAMM|nr:hypothetical protein [Thalassotalea eurytherma]GLX83714.1 hypothetical protein theurythT_31670 [Thalassotalea eurytherma]